MWSFPRTTCRPVILVCVGVVSFQLEPSQLRRVAYAGAAAAAAAVGASVAAYVASAPRVRFRVADIPRLQRADSTVRMGVGELPRNGNFQRWGEPALLAAG